MKPIKNHLLVFTAFLSLLAVSCEKQQMKPPAPQTSDVIGPGPDQPVDASIVYNGNLVVQGDYSSINNISFK